MGAPFFVLTESGGMPAPKPWRGHQARGDAARALRWGIVVKSGRSVTESCHRRLADGGRRMVTLTY